MLTNTQQKVLLAAIELSKCGSSVVSFYDIAYKFNIHPSQVFAAVKVLERKQLLEYVYNPETHTPVGVILTSYSLNLKEYRVMRIKSFFINNLIAIISLILSVIALRMSL